MGRGTLKHLLLPFSQFWEKGLGDEGHGALGSTEPELLIQVTCSRPGSPGFTRILEELPDD
jgi:hypothetical protein